MYRPTEFFSNTAPEGKLNKPKRRREIEPKAFKVQEAQSSFVGIFKKGRLFEFSKKKMVWMNRFSLLIF